jgi:hypothetical protein
VKKFLLIILVLAFAFCLGPPVAHADNFTLLCNYTAIVPSGHAANIGAAFFNPSDHLMVGNYYFDIPLATSVYNTENATCMAGINPVVKTSINSLQSSFDNYTSINDAITAKALDYRFISDADYYAILSTATANRSAIDNTAPEVVLKTVTSNAIATSNSLAYNPGQWKDSDVREILFASEGVTRA